MMVDFSLKSTPHGIVNR